MAKRHWLWDAYVALTQQRAMTEDDAMGQLESIWPTLPVRAIVRAEGNVNVTLADVMAADELARQTTRQTTRQGSGTHTQQQQGQQGSGTGQQQQDGQQGSGNESQGDDVTFNDLIRARAGRNGKTIELSHDELMGTTTEQQSPESDFNAMLRARTGRG